MNITEANAVNVVLRHVLGIRDEHTHVTPEQHLERLAEAAEHLADKANKALGAGLTSEQVRAAWGSGS